MPDTRPARIQRLRAKGFRLQDQSPDGRRVVYVGRPTVFGNRWTVAGLREAGYYVEDGDRTPLAACVEAYRFWLERRPHPFHGQTLPAPPDVTALRGKHLACWCPLDQPCHADVLLELANG